MRTETFGSATLHHGDWRELALGHVGALVTDPPYGILGRQRGCGKLVDRLLNTDDVSWDVAPSAEDFAALRALADECIVWGGNYFPLPPARCMLVWDKAQPWESFSQVELAWTTLTLPAKIFRRCGSGSINAGREHPTQKPVALMEWCLGFLESGVSVLDPYMGSGTTGVACVKLGHPFVGVERELRYFDFACRRMEAVQRQHRLFA